MDGISRQHFQQRFLHGAICYCYGGSDYNRDQRCRFDEVWNCFHHDNANHCPSTLDYNHIVVQRHGWNGLLCHVDSQRGNDSLHLESLFRRTACWSDPAEQRLTLRNYDEDWTIQHHRSGSRLLFPEQNCKPVFDFDREQFGGDGKCSAFNSLWIHVHQYLNPRISDGELRDATLLGLTASAVAVD